MKNSSNSKFLLTVATVMAFLTHPIVSSSAPIQSTATTQSAASTPSITSSYVIANFETATDINQVNGRIWYANMVDRRLQEGRLVVSRENNDKWVSFGIDPGCNRKNGEPIAIDSSYTHLHIDMEGTASQLKVEIYDRNGTQNDIWLNPTEFRWELPDNIKRGGCISKLQFVAGPGLINLRIKKIYLEKIQ